MASPRGGGEQAGQLAPPPTSDRTPREIDADLDIFMSKKMGDRFTGFALTFYMNRRYSGLSLSCDYEKEGIVKVVEGVTLVDPQ